METVHTFHYKEGFHAVRATGATVETSKRRGRVSMGLGGAGGAARQVEGGTEGRWGVVAQRTQYRPPPLQRVHATCWHCAPSSASPKGAALLPHLRLARPQSRPHTPHKPRPQTHTRTHHRARRASTTLWRCTTTSPSRWRTLSSRCGGAGVRDPSGRWTITPSGWTGATAPAPRRCRWGRSWGRGSTWRGGCRPAAQRGGSRCSGRARAQRTQRGGGSAGSAGRRGRAQPP